MSYTYPISKRTLTYAGFVRLANDSNARYNFNINSYGGLVAGTRLSGYVAGLSHNF